MGGGEPSIRAWLTRREQNQRPLRRAVDVKYDDTVEAEPRKRKGDGAVEAEPWGRER